MVKMTLGDMIMTASTTILAFNLGVGVAYERSNSDTPVYAANDNRLNAKVYSVVDNGKSLLNGRDIDFFVTDEEGDTLKVVRSELEGKRTDDLILKEFINSIQRDTSNRNIIFFGKYENDLKKIEYSVKPNGTIVPVRTFNADYALTNDGKLFPLMK